MRNDVHPEESPDRHQLVKRGAHEEIEQIHLLFALEAELLYHIHECSRYLEARRKELSQGR